MIPGDAINAILTLSAPGVAPLKFELDQDFTTGYRNTIEPPRGTEFGTHHRGLMWKGGSFKAIGVGLMLTCGVQTGLSTSDALVAAVTDIFKISLSTSLQTFGPPSKLSVGSWFVWYGYIQDLDVTWKEPYDIRTGKPMRADVRFSFLPDFLASDKIVDSKKLPYRHNFSFAFKR